MSFSTVLGNPKPQYEDIPGVPYVGMRLFFYAAGTSTKQDTVTDSIGGTTNTNPIVIGADGFPESNVMIYGDDTFTYKVVAAPVGVDDPPTSPLWTIDNVKPTSNAVPTFKAELADTTSATLGSFLVGVFLSATAYVGRKLSDWITDRPYYITDFLNASEIADVRAGTALIDVTTKVQAVITNYAALKEVVFPAGSYLTSTALRMAGGMSVRGEISPKSGKSSIIVNTASTHFDTLDTDSDFNGLLIRDLRLLGGFAASYAITSHYPYTNIEGVHIENTVGSFAGHGIRIHRDNDPGSMGGWGSKINDCKIVLSATDAVNPRTCIELHIHGGNVTVNKTETILCEVGINVVQGQNITLSEINTNKCDDLTSVSGTISKAAIVVGNGTSGFDVQQLTIKDCYLEGHSRAVLINNAVNTTIETSYINDIEYSDPAFGTPDGSIMHTQYASNTKIKDLYLETGYSTQRILHQVIGTNMIGMSVDNCYLYLDRVANSYTAGHVFSNNPNIFESIKATHFKSTISSSDTHSDLSRIVKYNNEDQGFLDSSIDTGVATTLFTILSGEVWEVISNQYDDDARFTKAIVHKPGSGAAAGIDDIITGTANALSLSTDAVQVTQTTGITRRIITFWKRII